MRFGTLKTDYLYGQAGPPVEGPFRSGDLMRREGFAPGIVSDPLLFRDPQSGAYVPLDTRRQTFSPYDAPMI